MYFNNWKTITRSERTDTSECTLTCGFVLEDSLILT
jgi:hypothetical protein